MGIHNPMFKPEELSNLSNVELIRHVNRINASIQEIQTGSLPMLNTDYARRRIQNKEDIIAGIGIELERRRGDS